MANPYGDYGQPQNPFTPEYLAKNQNKMKENPFTPGTRKYNDFVKSQTESMVEMAGAPVRPEFNSLIDPSTGMMKGPLSFDPTLLDKNSIPTLNAQVNNQGLNALRGEALRSGPSAWGNLAKQQVGAQELASLDKVGAQAKGANAAAESNLAMRGGIGTGARTSLAKDMARNINSGAQNVRRDASNSMLNVDLQDELKRMDTLKSLPSMELSNAGFELDKQKGNADRAYSLGVFNTNTANEGKKYNIGNTLNENLAGRAFDMGSYLEEMKNFSAGKSADAVAESGKK